jgi:hypothetical protein
MPVDPIVDSQKRPRIALFFARSDAEIRAGGYTREMKPFEKASAPRAAAVDTRAKNSLAGGQIRCYPARFLFRKNASQPGRFDVADASDSE